MIETNGRSVAEWNIPYSKGTLLEAIYGCKFITVEREYDRDVITIVFEERMIHDDMYKSRFRRRGIKSAGFIEVIDGKPVATGKSTSIEGEPCATDDDTKTIQEWYEIKKGEKK